MIITSTRVRGGKYRAFVRTDPYFNLVTLLLPGNGANGAQNNTFLDASTNNFAITRNGNTTQGTFSPFSLSGWSIYGNGSSSLTNPAGLQTAFAGWGGRTRTFEAWIYRNDTTSYSIQNAYAGVPQNGRWSININSSNNFEFRYTTSTNTEINLTTSATVPSGWAHVAVVVDSSTANNTTVYLCINGAVQTFVSQNFSTQTSTYTVGDLLLTSDFTPATFVGYITGVRWSNNLRYTSNFSVPVTAFTNDANTLYLIGQTNRFQDQSSNNYTVAVGTGAPRVQAFSPFQPGAPYSTDTNGGSLYLRGPVSGATDYLSIASDPAFQFGNSNFTVETWLYPTAVNTVAIYSKRANTSTAYGSIVFNIQSDRSVRVLGTVNGSSWGVNSQSNTLINANCWNHVAVTRNGTLWNIWVNGINSANSVLAGTIPDNPANVTVGTQGNNQSINNTPVYFSDLRVVKGTAVYTTNFTLPTSPLTAIANTSLLLNSTNAGIRDAAADNVIETIGNVQISTVQSKFGGSSISFDGSGDYFIVSSTTADPLLAFGTGDFTIEFWIRFNTTASVTILDYRPGSNGAYATIITDATNKIIYYSNSANRILGTTALVTNSWHHIAVVRSSGSTKLYINGINEGSAFADTQNYLSGANRPVVGTSGFPLGTGSLNAYIQDLRITQNLARYTANFTPPTQAFPTQ